MKRKALLFIFIPLFLFLFAGAGATEDDDNLLINGDFESIGNDGLPDGWFTDAYRMDPGYSVFSMTEGINGAESHAVQIQNVTRNDARFAQTVNVEPETMYCLSGYICTDGITEGHGANLSIEGIYAFSDRLYDTKGEWQKVEYYGETGPEQTEITVFVRLGGYSGESKGTAAFDRLSLTKKETVPDGILADLWYKPDDSIEDDDEYIWGNNEGDEKDTAASPAWPVLLAIALFWFLVLFAVIYSMRDGKKDLCWADRAIKFRIWPLMLFALFIRIFFCFFVEGYSVDVNCFLSWGLTMKQNGPAGFYQSTSFCDYPPLYTYVMGLNSWLCELTHADDGLTRVIFRLIPCICDVAGCWFIIKYLESKKQSEFYSVIVLALLAFNPATILNSACWGQMDSVLCLLLLGVAVFAVEKRWLPSVALYVTAVLVKPQALMLGFLGLAYMILAIVHDKKEWKRILSAVLIGVLLIILYILPFGIRQTPGWLIERYRETLSSYPYATVNAANFYYLLGGNWNAVERTANIIAPLFFSLCCAMHGILWFVKKKRKKNFIIEAILAGVFAVWFAFCAILRLNWTYTGFAAMAYAFVIVISMAVRHGEIRFLPYFGALLFILLYVFGIKMHERYLFPALLLLAFAWALLKDRRILYLLGLFSVTIFINEGIILDNSIRLGSSMGHLNDDTVWLADILSILNIIGAFGATVLGYSLTDGRLPADMKQLPSFLPIRKVCAARSVEDYHMDRRLHWTKKDTVFLCVITLLYSFMTLSTLGSTRAPQAAWSSSDEEEQIIFDLLDRKEDVRILYYGQVSREDFSLSQSDDGLAWSDEIWAQMDQGQCWKWKYVTRSFDGVDGRTYYNDSDNIIHFSGRYIRLTSWQVGLTLNELIFRDADGNRINAKVLRRIGGVEDSALYSDPENLLDEQDSMENLPGFFGVQQEGETQPSWWNSTYFDEIYHARTGYEFIKGTVPYETSHPPLGKIFISWCIMLFGMTPFGWRFAGALAGILMLPAIYLIAKQLMKKTWPAVFACSLMALDCMHLTQTQIATIDSFPVLFIILAFFFMLRFIQTDLTRSCLKSVLIPLCFSGLFMGLSIASKWIGIYAGIGLGILYFWHCIRQVLIDRKRNDPNSPDSLRRIFLLCIWCILFFIAVPLAVYLLSYIPYMAYNTRIANIGDYLNAVWRAQESMLSYHSTPGLGMDHPFYSPWWEWPIIGKPMYYAAKQYLPAGAKLQHSIFSFGNPVVWWGALAAVAAGAAFWLREKHYQVENSLQRWHLRSLSFEPGYGFLFISLLAQYLPWVLVPRGTYIYHYFASIPFLILITALCLNFGGKAAEKKMKLIGAIYLFAAFVLFVLLLPYASGMASPVWWLEIGNKLLKIWY